MAKRQSTRTLPQRQREALLATLQSRFEAHPGRHSGLRWEDVQQVLEKQPVKLWSLNEMELTGGEPDVCSLDVSMDIYVFMDCSKETPTGRRSLCYDRAALDARKENKPSGCVLGLAAEMGVELLTEAEYRQLQTLGEFDLKTSSWIATPTAIRDRGGALFCDRRYGQVFTYHNGAESYYAARGFRALLRVRA